MAIEILESRSVQELIKTMRDVNVSLVKLNEENTRLRNEGRLYSAEQIAEMWGIEVQTVRKHLKQEGIVGVELSDRRCVRFTHKDIMRFIDGKCKETMFKNGQKVDEKRFKLENRGKNVV